MPLECYVPKDFRYGTRAIIRQANDIIAEYQAEGYQLTLRQLYYQFVARDLIPNKQSEYKRLGEILNDARLAGLVDWDAIIDRTRNLQTHASWSSPQSILNSAAEGYAENPWADQDIYVETWIEKDALIGVIERVCEDWRVPYFACRGYTSQSEMWAAGKRFRRKIDDGKKVVVLHLGDHDPSGIQMSEDNMTRLLLFAGDEVYGDDEPEDEHIIDNFELRRIALNMDQVRRYNPPPNPAKETDSRIEGYRRAFGTNSSWELDALDPRVIADLIRTEVTSTIDSIVWDESIAREDKNREMLRECYMRWDEVTDFLKTEED